MVKQAVLHVNHAQIHSLGNQTVLSNEGKVPCTKKQQ